MDDALECNRRLLSGLSPSVAGEVDGDSDLCGRVVVEAGARIVRSRVVGPTITGADTVIEDGNIRPNVAIGPRCAVRDTRLNHSIVLDGASISAAPGIRGSVIDRSATIGPSGDGEVHHRLVVGDHARVEIAA